MKLPLAPTSSALFHRWITSAQVRPTAAGGWAVVFSMFIFGGFSLSLRNELDFAQWPPTSAPNALVFARILIVPSLAEESLFRVLLQPPGCTLTRILFTNTLFTAYHLINAAIANQFDRPGAARTFRDPIFLGLAFLLGNLCSYAYRISSHGLWAPVLVHAIPVTIWLSSLGGEAVLSERGER